MFSRLPDQHIPYRALLEYKLEFFKKKQSATQVQELVQWQVAQELAEWVHEQTPTRQVQAQVQVQTGAGSRVGADAMARSPACGPGCAAPSWQANCNIYCMDSQMQSQEHL